ncbi:hypothetical protein SOVF_019400 [Spinacia oleracea]|nr:hypothetical protein SOVF_019400 [Spinacia oleracea]
MEIDPLPNGNTATENAAARPASDAVASLAAAAKAAAPALKEVSAFISAVDSSSSSDFSRDDAVSHLSSLVSRLQGLKTQEKARGRKPS